MKKVLLIASFGLLVIVPSACKNKDKAGAGSSADKAYTLKMRLAPGDKFGQDMDVSMDMKMAGVMGMNMSMTMNAEMEVVGDTADLKKIKFVYTKTAMNMDMAGIPGGGAMDTAELNKNMRAMENKPIYLYMDSKNEIVKIDGYEDLMDDAYTDDPQLKAQMDKMYSKDELNNMMGMMFRIYPDHPVKVGDKWENVSNFKMGPMSMELKNKYKLKEVENGVAVIEVDADYSGGGKMDNTGGMNMKMDMDGKQKGTVSVSTENGYMKAGNYDMTMKADATVMGQKVPIDMTGKYTMKGH